VHTDNVAAARALTERLLELGHRHIAFVSPPPQNTSSIEERLKGFHAAFAEPEREPGKYRAHQLTTLRATLPGSFTPEHVSADVATIRAFRAEAPEVTAYVACEYNLARMLDRAFATQATPAVRPTALVGSPTADGSAEQTASPRQPDDQRHEPQPDDQRHERRPVIACFDSPGDPISGAPYLHVRQDPEEMGRQAVDLLMARLRGESVPNLSLVPFRIVDADDN
jgi:DNA-binding LacI/PurR family transcriptional regulator